LHVGMSGWTFDGWRGGFYPRGLIRRKELEYASRQVNSIELNGTFYSLQKPQTFTKWHDETPNDFCFSVKAPQYITHIRRLKEIEQPLANFFASGVLRLGSKLGPILWQFPPNFRFEPDRLEAFLKMLPHDMDAASAIARRHDKRIIARASIKAEAKGPVRHAMEIRNESFVTPKFIDMLRAHDVALVCADAVEWPRLMDVTSDFVYCRLHGSEQLYASGYDDQSLDLWAARVAAWARGREPADARYVTKHRGPKKQARDVFVYFDNDAKVRAPFDAQALMKRVSKLLGK
jgi:uncharacterized protein YecE (DUF72 family)